MKSSGKKAKIKAVLIEMRGKGAPDVREKQKKLKKKKKEAPLDSLFDEEALKTLGESKGIKKLEEVLKKRLSRALASESSES